MNTYEYDSLSLVRNGKRWFPVMGEIHYSRYPAAYWKEALLKMKAGGVDIVSSYVIWIHHEEVEGEWDWSGLRNLRHFVETVRECGLTMCLRVGPWIHGEVRNGGFPDWLVKRCGEKCRTNDEAYLAEVRKFYEQIYAQVKGLFNKDGGPVIAVQVENELGHCGGAGGAEGEKHIAALKSMLEEIGFDVPLWTATGWGGAVTGGLLPVMGGYCDAPWDQRTTEIEPSGNFVFTYERNDHAIGSDYGLGEGISFDMDKFPYLTAELGGGLQVTYKRRPVPTATDIAAMSIAKLGSGCNLLGYYMYHGGTNPDGKLGTLQETTASGSFCDLPVKTYDFMAPLGEWGYPSATFFALQKIAAFVHKNGEDLCAMETYIPPENPVVPTDFKHLRWSVRYNKEKTKAFLFVNNYQRHNELYCHHQDVDLGALGLGTVHVEVLDGEWAVYGMNVDGFNQRYWTVVLSGSSKTEDTESRLVTEHLGTVKSRDMLYADQDGEEMLLHIESRGIPSFSADIDQVPDGFVRTGEHEFIYAAKLPPKPGFTYSRSQDDGRLSVQVHVDGWGDDHFGVRQDVLLRFSYTGNGASLYKDGKLVADNIYLGPGHCWEVGLRRFGNTPQDFTLVIDPLRKNQECYLEKWPDFDGKDQLCSLESISLEQLVRVTAVF